MNFSKGLKMKNIFLIRIFECKRELCLGFTRIPMNILLRVLVTDCVVDIISGDLIDWYIKFLGT